MLQIKYMAESVVKKSERASWFLLLTFYIIVYNKNMNDITAPKSSVESKSKCPF